MDAQTEIAKHRLRVLQLAEELGSAAEACRLCRMDRTSFHRWKRRYAIRGFEGLKDLPPVPKSYPSITPREVAERIKALSIANPAYGCNRLEHLLSLEGSQVSSVTIQKVLNKAGLGTRHERWLALEEQIVRHGAELTDKQVAYLEKINPCFRERHRESSQPGELLCQDVFLVSAVEGAGKVYLHSVIDTYGSFAFGVLDTSKQAEAALALLHNRVLPFYDSHGIPMRAILTHQGREFRGAEGHIYERYLSIAKLEHRTIKVWHAQMNGFVERFRRTVQEEFLAIKLRDGSCGCVDVLQADLEIWLHYYNYERPHMGYRNLGRRPWDIMSRFTGEG